VYAVSVYFQQESFLADKCGGMKDEKDK